MPFSFEPFCRALEVACRLHRWTWHPPVHPPGFDYRSRRIIEPPQGFGRLSDLLDDIDAGRL